MPDPEVKVILKIRQSEHIPKGQKEAWDEFLDMLLERAEVGINTEVEDSLRGKS